MNVKAIETIYIAGKMQDDDWRRDLFDDTRYESSHPHKCNPVISFDTSFNHEPWPEYSETVCGLRYTGPFFVDNLGGHGYSYEDFDEHGANIVAYRDYKHSADQEMRREQVQSWCFDAIKRADVVFAWIDSIDCYGTIAEIGYAAALGKTIFILGPRRYADLWFVYQMADQVDFMHNRNLSLRDALENMMAIHRRMQYSFDSPIEESFWNVWCNNCRNSPPFALIPQHPIGKYRVDFAHIPSKTAIELDGFASHSSTEDIANDRKRQRWIEEQGWYVIRFGGKEIFSDVAHCAEETWKILARRQYEAEQ